MLTKKEKELVDYLTKKKRWVTSDELASFSNCTTRTIRNRVARINQNNQALILTSHFGYQLNPEAKIQTRRLEDRKSRIFLELLKHSSEGVDFYELAEKLFVSESTLKNDIQQLKKEITNDAIQIVFEQDFIKLTGPERAKRRYLISLLYNESDLQEKLKASIQQMIGYISLDNLQQTIQAVLSTHSIQINQYSLNNIVLHFAISIERIRQGHSLKKCLANPQIQHHPEFLIAEEISDQLAQQYDIHFSQAELEQLSLLFIGMQNETLTKQDNQQLSSFVDQKIIVALQDVLAEVERTYLVELHDEEFFNKLAIHLQSLYYRSHYETFTRNSSLLDLKTAYPLIYDLAVYISSLIQDRLDIWFNDDEISFIALHIGSFLETQKQFQNQVSIQLIVNNYHDLARNLSKQLKEHFGETVHVLVTERGKHFSKEYDLLLTTDREIASKFAGSVFIHPFLTTKDIKKIEKRMDSLKSQREKRRMYQSIEKFILPELYFNQIDPAGLKPIEIRMQMNQRMLENGFVDAAFFERVEKRERMSPTSFPSGIAVPHSVELEAERSGVAIMTLQEPLVWADHSIKLIAYIAINKDEANAFNDFFEKFIEIVSEPINTKQLSMSEDYEEFILRLKAMVDADE
ncbi:BglG family transcription antiterminator [Enterococcus raffinosus]|uniref:BglG family transcription antiterminator n=1 Tax=Enterococcus raffinosus TaxID=71452 RepID=A0AAW8TCN6_9ENTE|nr:BglG family transcription antiterminator [Enterococcus raffinosus]MDT2524530.1 BglG family transcription antiterminator [Enterococcus raffinosus]MDT2530662.1 BglG family transcription antiterminator [Enterococcus raffinosus]MDT2534497.1 BglG family transcription antiterminator [Enterococcus raffinosus]MDT2545549.1 BglG family transcription antiterminator [Enterococcus raffinosus]MDT2555582.1 BglG family transcription antiterminator [Enterococcus raffinosus]